MYTLKWYSELCKPKHEINLKILASFSYKVSATKIKTGRKGDNSKSRMRNLFYTEFEEDNLESGEKTFSNLHLSAEERKSEMKKHEKTMRLKSIERKYFADYKKSQMPKNFLTWSMKEHIKQLYNMDPYTWNCDTIVEYFPTTREQVQAIVKSDRKAPDNEYIQKHDLSVIKNWKEVTDGRIGNLNLIKKVMDKRIFDTGSGLPSATISAQDRISFIENLSFTPPGEDFDDDHRAQRELPIQPKKPVFIFRNILNQFNSNSEKSPNKKSEDIQRCDDLMSILPSDSSQFIKSESVPINSKFSQNFRNKSLITLEEFKKRKLKKF